MSKYLLLENGLNTDYIYSLIIGLFYSQSDGINKIINNDTDNPNTYYIQEYIKIKIIYTLHKGYSIESSIINKLRLYMYNCGWLKNTNEHILQKGNIDKFFIFLINEMMNYKLEFTRVNISNNTSNEKTENLITVDDNLSIVNSSAKMINISECLNEWVSINIMEKDKYSYKFNNTPLLIPIYINITDEKTKLNKKLINIMETINFESAGDKLHRMFVWDIHSVICQDANGSYYTAIKNNQYDIEKDKWTIFSDNSIPSNSDTDMHNVNHCLKLMQEVKFIFYKIQ